MPHVPERTCIVTREKKPKSELIKIVGSKNKDKEEVHIDIKQNLPGRGVYILPKLEILEEALKKKKLEQALGLKRKFNEDELIVLRKEFAEALK